MTLRLSPGLVTTLMGQNLVANGFFTSATTSWAGGGGAVDATLTSETGGVSGNCLKVLESGGGTSGYATQTVTVKVGRKYTFEAYFKLGDGTNGSITLGTAAGGTQYYTSGNITDATWARYKCEFIATTTTCFIGLWANQDGKYNYFDAVRLSPVASVRDIFEGGSIKIYSGTQPATADLLPPGNLLVTITANGGTGLTFDDAVLGVLSKAAAESWYGTVVYAGTNTAGWFRLQALGDLGTTNNNDERIDGAISTSGSQLNFTSTSFTLGAVETITSFALTLPMA